MNLNTEDPLKIQVKLAEDPIKIQIHMPETPVIRVELGAGPQGRKGEPGEKGDPGDDYVLTEKDKDDIAKEAAQTLAPELETKADKEHLQELEDKYIPDIQFLVKENILEANGLSADELNFEYSLPDDVDESNQYHLFLSCEMSGSTIISSDECCFVEIEVTNADDSVDDYVFIKSEPRNPVFDIGVNNWYSGIKSMNYSPGWKFYFSKDEDEESIYTYIYFPKDSQMSDIIRNAKSIAFTAWEAADNNWKYIQYKPPIMPGTGMRAVVDNIDLDAPAQRENVASGVSSHAEGFMTAATAKAAHSEGRLTTASGEGSHAEGGSTKALGECSHAWGGVTIAASKYQTAYGKYNVQDDNNEYAEIVGNGTYKTRSNARALTWTGDERLAGDVYVHSEEDSSGGNKLATENYVDDAVSHISSMTIHICTAQEYDAQTGIPTIANPDATTFYLVPGGDAPNMYIEWIYTNNAWEQFGSASIDLSNYVQKTDYASASAAGVAKVSGAMGIDIVNGFLTMATADHAYIQDGTHTRKAIPPKFQHEAAFYGLAKAAGDTTQSQSSNPVGTYTPEAKAAIQQMLDVPSKSDIPSVPVGDVQLNGVSIVNKGIANVPCANANILGVVQTEAEYGITIMSGTQGKLRVQQASAAQVRAGQQAYKPIVPANQHTAVFYGLAAAAGDTTQSQSANAVGSYTDEAKAAIRAMLGLDDTSIVDIVQTGLPAAEEVEW